MARKAGKLESDTDTSRELLPFPIPFVNYTFPEVKLVLGIDIICYSVIATNKTYKGKKERYVRSQRKQTDCNCSYAARRLVKRILN